MTPDYLKVEKVVGQRIKPALRGEEHGGQVETGTAGRAGSLIRPWSMQ